ncbi:hypothetical protein [Clostridium sp. JN-9]|uniref:hypothetical protein n=1 Tax=Clostridium sp. JN-9 TaxID=2507159 RepID=UPI000FFE330B|nr:hypothetical protein [Clostridium sp. JN-9]QAT40418.1 hypothetical protein EQM05_09180 [Clostridium sp. JN-9]
MTANEYFESIYSLDPRKIAERYKFLGEGISRKVYALNEDLVVKVAKGSEGIYQNSVEHYVFTHADNNFRKYLCPIIWFKPRLLIMKRAVSFKKITRSRFVDLRTIRPEPNSLNEINYYTSKFFLYYNDIRSAGSWGKLADENVLIDYGCTNAFGDYYYDFIFSFLRY